MNLPALNEIQWISQVNKDNKLREIFVKIREIDKQRNGFVTELELDDIIKLVYTDLEEYDISNIIRPFCCRENKILIDYKKFRTHVT